MTSGQQVSPCANPHRCACQALGPSLGNEGSLGGGEKPGLVGRGFCAREAPCETTPLAALAEPFPVAHRYLFPVRLLIVLRLVACSRPARTRALVISIALKVGAEPFVLLK